ncbi:trehalose-phosphatase [Stappia sediminis]|nr:trehalose-phosphatase [Stappia sediminis]
MSVFLDFDGTLVEIADKPEDVDPADGLKTTLSGCLSFLGGAVAVVSGRPIQELDWFLSPLRLPAAGLHGLEYRLKAEDPVVAAEIGTEIDVLRERLACAKIIRDGVFVEDKGSALAVHYRAVPQSGPDILAFMKDAIADLEDLHLVSGKMVVEAKPDFSDKGSIVEAFMEERPFQGRIPVFIGDDTTDEDGMRAARQLGGFGVKVGAGESIADFRLKDVAAVHDWLAAGRNDNL